MAQINRAEGQISVKEMDKISDCDDEAQKVQQDSRVLKAPVGPSKVSAVVRAEALGHRSPDSRWLPPTVLPALLKSTACTSALLPPPRGHHMPHPNNGHHCQMLSLTCETQLVVLGAHVECHNTPGMAQEEGLQVGRVDVRSLLTVSLILKKTKTKLKTLQARLLRNLNHYILHNCILAMGFQQECILPPKPDCKGSRLGATSHGLVVSPSRGWKRPIYLQKRTLRLGDA